MKIGLIDVDSHNFPNLCLMKLSEYHTRKGDRVEWWNPGGRYDLVYKSRGFTDTYSKDEIIVNNADEVIRGGTGYGPGGGNLPDEVEHIMPDYFLYPRFLGTAYGFLTSPSFGGARMKSSCWTRTCWPARTMNISLSSWSKAEPWWILPRGLMSGL